MKIQSYTPPAAATRNLKTPRPPQESPQETFTSGQGAFQSVSTTSRNFTKWNMAAACATTMGIGVGAMLQTALSCTPLSFAVGGACALAAAYGGYHGGAAVSDWAGRLGARIDSNQPERGEAIGRTVMNAATGLVLLQSPGVAALQLGLTGINGFIVSGKDK